MIKGIPTKDGINTLNGTLKKDVLRYALVGLETPADETLQDLIAKNDLTHIEIKKYIFFNKFIEAGYYDDNGILTYEIDLATVKNSLKYLYAILLLDKSNKVIASLPTPQVILSEGVGGVVTIKLPIKGEPCEVIFTNSDYVTRNEFSSFKNSIKQQEINTDEIADLIAPKIQAKKDLDIRTRFALHEMEQTLALRRLAKKINDRTKELPDLKFKISELLTKELPDLKFKISELLKVQQDFDGWRHVCRFRVKDSIPQKDELFTGLGNSINKYFTGSREVKIFFDNELLVHVKENGTKFNHWDSDYKWQLIKAGRLWDNSRGAGINTPDGNWVSARDCPYEMWGAARDFHCAGRNYGLVGNGSSLYYHSGFYHYSYVGETFCAIHGADHNPVNGVFEIFVK